MTTQQIIALTVTSAMQKQADYKDRIEREFGAPASPLELKGERHRQKNLRQIQNSKNPEALKKNSNPGAYQRAIDPVSNVAGKFEDYWTSVGQNAKNMTKQTGRSIKGGAKALENAPKAMEDVASLRGSVDEVKKGLSDAKSNPLGFLKGIFSDKKNWPWLAAIGIPMMMMAGGSMSSMGNNMRLRNMQQQPQRPQRSMQPYAFR